VLASALTEEGAIRSKRFALAAGQTKACPFVPAAVPWQGFAADKF